MPDAYEHIVRRGVTLNRRTFAMLEMAEERIGRQLTLTQGSFSTAVKKSSKTHFGGGALDIRARHPDTPDRPMPDASKVVRELRKAGFAAWLRTPSQDKSPPPKWPFHIHALAIGDKDMHPEAQAQVDGYLADPPSNGLASGAPDDGPRVKFKVFPQKLPEDDVALSDDDKKFLTSLVHGLDKTVKVVGRNPEGAQVEDMLTLGGRLLLIQDDTDNIQRRLSLLAAAVGNVDDQVLATVSAKMGPIVAAELKKLPKDADLTEEQVRKAVAVALREALPQA
jgi:hypothetical protein